MKSLIVLVSLGIVVLGLVACGGEPAPAPTPVPPPAATIAPAPAPAPSNPAPTNPAPPANAVVVSLQDPGGSGSYIYDPSEFTFSVGETVTFALTSESEFHTFTVDDLGIDLNVDAETTETLTFTFDEAGTFELICIPHEALGMVGTITVQ